MKLHQLRYFVTVCSCGSVTGAARRLSVSQSALSSAVRELEKEFGLQLFERNGKTLELTQEGKTFRDLAEDILARSDHAEQIMADLAENRNHHIRIGITPMLCSVIMPMLYRKFSTEYPKIRLDVAEDGRYPLFEQLEHGDLDLLIMSESSYVRPIQQIYQRLLITKLEYVCCVGKNNRLAGYSRVTAADIGDSPLIIFRQGYHQQEFIQNYFADAGLKPNIALSSGQLSTILEMTAYNGLTTFVYRNIPQQMQYPGLVSIPINVEPVNICVFWKKGGFYYTAMDKMIRCIQSIDFQSQPLSGKKKKSV